MYIIKRFEDKVAVVTGGAKGIGQGCCLRFAAKAPRSRSWIWRWKMRRRPRPNARS